MSLTTNYSTDSLFSIGIPIGYALTHKAPGLLAYEKSESDSQHTLISVMQEPKIEPAIFHEKVNQQYEKTPPKFNIVIKQKNDSIVHCKITAGLFNADEFYFLKRGDSHDYFIKIATTQINKTEAIEIASSFKEYVFE